MKPWVVGATAVLLAATSWAENNPLTGDARSDYTVVRNFIVRAAEKMPADDYSFKPTREVRSFGQLIGHIADDQYRYCSAVRGETKSSDYEKNPPPKDALVAALRAAFAYCDATYEVVSDEAANRMVQFSGRELPTISVLTRHAGHACEHYGNVVVYMRLRGPVPPSSEKKP